ncbi:ef-hand protein [Anaeramoeba flamelloides]|uniref:Ef-hand protein n=1 Tax=Anaeramoeba flamelloides TaxID=1746091 RepID=A0AAV8ACS7_9EUKA|nr:ef-hand protein [Anaeramoeba flamelloides]
MDYSNKQRELLMESFKQIDTNNDGLLSFKETLTLFRILGQKHRSNFLLSKINEHYLKQLKIQSSSDKHNKKISLTLSSSSDDSDLEQAQNESTLESSHQESSKQTPKLKNETINFETFLLILKEVSQIELEKEKINKSFDDINRSQTGVISVKELQHILTKMSNELITESNYQEVLQFLPVDENQNINLESLFFANLLFYLNFFTLI